MKIFIGNSVFRQRSARVLAALLAVALLAACAARQPVVFAPPPFRDSTPEIQVDDVDMLALTPEMEAFLERYILLYPNMQTRLFLLTTAVTSSGVLGFRYDDRFTYTAAEAFKKRSGNCIGFANMMVAMARRAGLKAHFQEVIRRREWTSKDDTVLLVKHVNVVVEGPHTSYVMDISGIRTHPDDVRRMIDDTHAKTLYFNNIGAELLLDYDLKKAYAYLRKAIETDPQVTDAWVNLGVVFGRNGQLEDAQRALQTALQIDASEYSAMSNLYDVYVEQENMEAAALLEAKVERYRRKNPYYLLKLSEEALELRQFEESIRLLRSAIRKKDDDHKLHFALAKTRYLYGQTEAAQESLERARELAPANMLAYYGRPLEELVTEP